MSKNIKFIDLFAGTGAFHKAFINTDKRYKCVFSNDLCKNAKKIYELNFPESQFVLGNLNDIKISSIPKHDILCGGFPCQPFSLAGQKKRF